MNRWNPDLLEQAWAFAARRHKGQTYGGQAEGERVEYMAHIGSVVTELGWALQVDATADGDLALRCAALHDTIEDTGTTHAQLTAAFGAPVADGVQALSKDPAIDGKRAQLEDSLRRILLQPREVWMVKLADRIANLYGPPFYWDNEKILAYHDEAALILRTLGGASEVLAARLGEKIAAYPRFLRS